MLAAALPAWAAEPAPAGWLEADGLTPSALALAALRLLADAAGHGLEPADYGAPALQAAWGAMHPPWTAAAAARWDRALTAAMLQYLNDLHRGRLPPSGSGTRFKPDAGDRFDAAATLHAALAMQDIALAERAAAPSLAQYDALRHALARYRALVDHPAWQRPLALPHGLSPGDSAAGVPRLAQRLLALGDLASPFAGGERYDGALAAGVRAFQSRHGLAPDAVIGPATAAALAVAPARRARQLELALERLRSTPLRQAPRMVVVNVPEFVLRAYAVDGDRMRVQVETKVIVGRALDTRTPLIGEDLRRIEFRPHWNVPPSIARGELVPLLRRDPALWEREGFEFVGAEGLETRLSDDGLQAVLDGRARIRQRPGPRNALGDIKFVFPNRESIYLHHTPSVGLFERARRDFSHGCIRVEDPVALAAFALQGQAGWDEARIRAAMGAGQPSSVTLDGPLPVLVAYGTALVKAGRVHFFDDLYGHDRGLDAALRRHSAGR